MVVDARSIETSELANDPINVAPVLQEKFYQAQIILTGIPIIKARFIFIGGQSATFCQLPC